MFYEYALEPAVLSSWDRTRFFLDAFGPWKGRFLAEYPRRWKKMVIDELACGDLEKKRIVERLVLLDKRVFSPRAGAPYDGTLAWIQNAEAEHGRSPFRAIVVSSASAKSHLLNAADLDDRHELWRVESGCFVPREARAFARSLELLLLASKRVVVIDPYFRADQPDKTRPLVEFCKLAFGRASVEVHFSDEKRGYVQSMTDANRALPGILPAGMDLTLSCWKERPNGARLHNRYLLTEVGGVKFGDSIEASSACHQDHLSILDEPSRARLWDEYVGPVPAFDSAGPLRTFQGVAPR